MSIFDALSGNIGHFNSIAVPIYNDISRNTQKISSNPVEMTLFGVVALAGVAQQMVDLFFKPGPNSLIETIKQYDQEDMRNLYAIFMIWAVHDFINYMEINDDEFKNKLKQILNLQSDKFDYYFSRLAHSDEAPIGLEKLWKELILIIHDLPDTEENYLIFCREFSQKIGAAFQLLS